MAPSIGRKASITHSSNTFELLSIEHRPSGHTVKFEQAPGVGHGFVMDGNWGDHTACLDKEPFPKILFAKLFNHKQQQGPWSRPQLKQVDFVGLCDRHYAEWTAARKGTECVATKDETKKCLSDMRVAKRKAALEHCAAKAQGTMKRKKAERVVEMK